MTDTSPDGDAHLREQPLRRRDVYQGKLLHVFEDTVLLPDGREARREVAEHPGAAAVVAVTDQGHVVLVRQWRHAVGRALWEIPAGTLDAGEEPLACAQRELREETGYSARRWTALGHGACSPGTSGEIVHLFLAEGLSEGESKLDEDESLDVRGFDRGDIMGLLQAGDTDLKTVAGLGAARLLGVPVQP